MSASEKHPILLAAAVIIKDGRVLITRRDPAPYWHLPDGDIRYGEDSLDCLRRSIGADLGLGDRDVVLEQIQPIYVSETIRRGNDRHYVTLHYRAAIVDPSRVRPRTGLVIDRLPPSSVLGLPILESTRATLQHMGFKHLNG